MEIYNTGAPKANNSYRSLIHLILPLPLLLRLPLPLVQPLLPPPLPPWRLISGGGATAGELGAEHGERGDAVAAGEEERGDGRRSQGGSGSEAPSLSVYAGWLIVETRHTSGQGGS